MKNNYKYTSLLRINPDQIVDICDKLSEFPDAFEEIIIFSQFTHSIRTLDEHRKTAEMIKPTLEKIKSMGIRAGINILCTAGFFPEKLDPGMKGYKKMQYYNGGINEGSLCPNDEKSREHMREQYKIYASLNPDIIYIDDDISGLKCFCDDCVKRMDSIYNIFDDCEPDNKNLKLKMEDENPLTRKLFREKFMEFTAFVRSELFQMLEKTVHEINPDIEMGFMTYITGSDGIDTDTWALSLKGNADSIRWRPGGGAYTEFNNSEIIEKAHHIGIQINGLPDFVRVVESEMENFPYQSLKKTPSYTAFESLIYLGAGCTGTAFNVLSQEEGIGEEHTKFFKMATDVYKTGEKIVNLLKREKPCGIGFWWDKKTAADIASAEWNTNKKIPLPYEISQVGIPVSYANETTCVFLLNKTIAMQMSDEELKELLGKGVLMDGEALEICNERGFDELTGFKVIGRYKADTIEKTLEHNLNMHGTHKRNPRQAFGFCKDTFAIEKTDDKAEYLSENCDLDGTKRGMASGVFENKLGGRIAVEGINPFDWYYSLPRSIHLKKISRWLSKDTMPAYISSFHRMVLWARGKGLFVANIAMEDATDAEIAIKTQSQYCEVTVKGANIINTVTVEAKVEETGYKFFELPEIPITGTALIELK